jgi:hypothetical protein
MIGERVYAIKRVGFRLNKDRVFNTPFGRYSFHYLPEELFSLALMPAEKQGYGFRLATAEKALLNTLYKIGGISPTKQGVIDLIYADLRLNQESARTRLGNYGRFSATLHQYDNS